MSTPTPTVDRILVALKSIVGRGVNSHCWNNSGSSECYGHRVMMDPPDREMINVVDSYFLQCGRPICEGELCNSLCGGSTGEGN